jgi:hypothetical protein
MANDEAKPSFVIRASSFIRHCLAASLVAGAAVPVAAQSPLSQATAKQHLLLPDGLPPGSAGQARLVRGGPLAGWFQPVQFLGPDGLGVSVAIDGSFSEPLPSPLTVGLLVGPVYRFRVTDIPGSEGREVFPTVELVDRLYPPAGAEARFPIPLELTAEDLRLALAGHFVTRVVYLEDPNRAVPAASDPNHPGWYDAGPGANPLVEADRLGRPVAIVRLGGRLPVDRLGPDQHFLAGCPPLKIFHRTKYSLTAPTEAAEQPRTVEAPQDTAAAAPIETVSDESDSSPERASP